MIDAQVRLEKCFSSVFRDLPSSEIPNASLTSVSDWDSEATITLLTVIEEEFNVQFEPEEIEHVLSFESILQHLQSQKGVP
jgi:acyl carrier protein